MKERLNLEPKSDKAKQGRVRMKVARAEHKEAGKKWLKRQAIEHTCGNDDDDDTAVEDQSLSNDDNNAITLNKTLVFRSLTYFTS